MNERRHRTNQTAQIVELLRSRRGAWVGLLEILPLAAQYNTRIFEARRQGLRIENKTETRDGIRHSWFRLVERVPAARAVGIGTLPLFIEGGH